MNGRHKGLLHGVEVDHQIRLAQSQWWSSVMYVFGGNHQISWAQAPAVQSLLRLVEKMHQQCGEPGQP